MTNGEKYKTARERVEAFNKYCEKMRDRPGGSCKKQERCSVCSLNWLDLECEEEKLLPCPFCGHGVSYRKGEIGGFIVCACGYSTNIQSSKEEAIATHNRVAKAVMESEAK